MKIRKLLTPILATAGTIAAATPLFCLTSCGAETPTKEIFTVNTERYIIAAEPTTKSWRIDALLADGATMPSNLKVTARVTESNSTTDIVQCYSTIENTTVHVDVGFVCKETTVKETTAYTTTFNLVFEWSEEVSGKKQTYKQEITNFSLYYIVVEQ